MEGKRSVWSAILLLVWIVVGCATPVSTYQPPQCSVPEEEVSKVKQQAEAGDPEAQFSVAHWYRIGDCLPQGFTEATDWYRRAADQGHSEAQRRLAIMYHYGTGIPPDIDQAVTWYRKAAEQGDVNAALALGHIYYQGTYLPRDLDEDEKWYRMAAERGEAYGRSRLTRVLREKDPMVRERELKEQIDRHRLTSTAPGGNRLCVLSSDR